MTLEGLRREFKLGNLSCQCWGDEMIIYMNIKEGLVGTITVKLHKNGTIEIVEILIVTDRKGASPLKIIAEREKIPQVLITKAMLKEISERSVGGWWD